MCHHVLPSFISLTLMIISLEVLFILHRLFTLNLCFQFVLMSILLEGSIKFLVIVGFPLIFENCLKVCGGGLSAVLFSIGSSGWATLMENTLMLVSLNPHRYFFLIPAWKAYFFLQSSWRYVGETGLGSQHSYISFQLNFMFSTWCP